MFSQLCEVYLVILLGIAFLNSVGQYKDSLGCLISSIIVLIQSLICQTFNYF